MRTLPSDPYVEACDRLTGSPGTSQEGQGVLGVVVVLGVSGSVAVLQSPGLAGLPSGSVLESPSLQYCPVIPILLALAL